MSPAAYIVLLIIGWLALAGTMLWAMLRISRSPRHHRHSHPETDKPVTVKPTGSEPPQHLLNLSHKARSFHA
ncbi:hypothetical protein [Pseudomonas sp. WAC2]|uniref:hypothetical protein n=1 Tax=Pseudomonas sp. WAC2 TaxID=3055057 RepID=UPI0025B14961|nr:hypothetical protein [Pseudomonas sp. WAC2]MDN3236884.1 hypothetical protein [Pseudomonas sp. WAC2]